MAPHSSTPAWKIPWTAEPGRLQSMGSLRVGHDWATLLSLFTFMHWRRQWHPTPVLLPGKSRGRRSLVGCSPWGRSESDTTERLSDFTFIFHLHALEKEMATHSSVLALENPRDGRAWWAAVYGVTQSRTQLKRLSSSSSNLHSYMEMRLRKIKSLVHATRKWENQRLLGQFLRLKCALDFT